jgi:hypothetical protein
MWLIVSLPIFATPTLENTMVGLLHCTYSGSMVREKDTVTRGPYYNLITSTPMFCCALKKRTKNAGIFLLAKGTRSFFMILHQQYVQLTSRGHMEGHIRLKRF